MRALELKLVRYRGESTEYVYFWTEIRNGVDVHIGPMFENKEDALAWCSDIFEKVEQCVSKLGRM